MTRNRRANGAGNVYIKHGQYYGRWYTVAGRRTNRKLGPVRQPGTATGLTRKQAEKRLRAIMDEVELQTDPKLTIAAAGAALLAQLEAKGSSRSHRETVESHLRVHLVPFFKERSLDRIGEDDVTSLLVAMGRREPVQAGRPSGGPGERRRPLSHPRRAPTGARARDPGR